MVGRTPWGGPPGGIGNSGARPASPARNRAATASSCRTCPNVKARRNEPNVDGAYALVNTRPIPPCRSSAMSSILSAPATMPATSEATFNPGFAPLSLGTLSLSSARSRNPAASANAMIGTNPADDTRFGSSNATCVARSV